MHTHTNFKLASVTVIYILKFVLSTKFKFSIVVTSLGGCSDKGRDLHRN